MTIVSQETLPTPLNGRAAWQWRMRFCLCVIFSWMAFGSMAEAAETLSGYIAVGGRTVDVDGDDNKYRQHVNLDSGVQLFDFGIVFEPEAKTAGAPDRIEVSATGIGGDPYRNIRLGVRKFGKYRFTYERQKSDYFYEDILIDPADENPNASNGGDFHHFDFERIRDRVNFDLHLNDRAKLILGFDQYTKAGDSTTVLDVSREEFELDQPIDQTLRNFDVGFEYRWNTTSISLNQRWREFDNDAVIRLLGESEGSSPGSPTRLDGFLLEQRYGYDSQETQVGLSVRPNERWVVQTGLLYADLDLATDSLETATGLDFLGAPLQTSLAGEGGTARSIRQLFMSTGYAISRRLRLTARIRDRVLDQEGVLQLSDVAGSSDWRIDSTSISLGVETIVKDWSLSAGWTRDSRDSKYNQSNGGVGRDADVATRSDGYYLIAGYRRGDRFSLHLSAEDNSVDQPFTFSAPTDSRRYRLRTGYRWDSGLKLNATYLWRKYENSRTGWEATSEQTDFRLSYSAAPVTVSLGTAFVDVNRDIDQIVSGGSRQVQFPVSYTASSDFLDGQVRWQVVEPVNVVVSYRQYDGDGSFAVKRDDARLRLNVDVSRGYRISATFRKIEYEEAFENFDANIWELSVGLRW